MRQPLLLSIALLAATTSPAIAQDRFYDNFDGYPNGFVLHSAASGWFGWDNVPGAAGLVDNTVAHSQPHSMFCGPGIDAVRPSIGATSGRWRVSAMIHIASGGVSQAPVYFILNSVYNHNGPYTWTGQIKFDGTTVDDDLRSSTARDIVFDQFVPICADIDLDNDTVVFSYNGEVISEGVYSNNGPTALENIDLYSAGGTCHFDDVTVQQVFEDDFEGYANGTQLNGVGGWGGFAGSAASAGVTSNTVASSGRHSMLVAPGTHAVQPDLGALSGKWTLSGQLYIPAGGLNSGDVLLNLNNVYAPPSSFNFASQLTCSGTTIDDGQRSSTPQQLVFDSWAVVRVDIDLGAGTIAHYYNGGLISMGTYAANGGPDELANIGFASTGGTGYWDDLVFEPVRKARSEVYGTGCAGSNGSVPAIGATGKPSPNDPTFAIELTQAAPGASAILLFSISQGRTPLGSCTLLVGLPSDTVATVRTSATGTATVPLGVPASVSPGAEVFMQWGILDPGGTYLGILSFSDGLRLVIGD